MKTRTPKQQLTDMLRRKKYRGCRGQVSSHGCDEWSIQIFSGSGKLLADYTLPWTGPADYALPWRPMVDGSWSRW